VNNPKKGDRMMIQTKIDSEQEVYHLFHIFRPHMNDFALWKLYEVVCDEIEKRQEELTILGWSDPNDWRLKPIPRVNKENK